MLIGSNAESSQDLSIGTVVLTYYLAGGIGGALVGSMLPLGRHIAGRVVLGLIAAFILAFCISTAMAGPFWHWEASEWEFVGFFVVVMGGVGSILWRRVTGL